MERASSRARWRWRAAEAPGGGRDDILALPTEILDNILGRLPFEDLVLTNGISRAWHRRWQSVPDLDIKFRDGSTAATSRAILWRCAAPVRGFTAHVRTRRFLGPERPTRWLRAVARPARWLFPLAHKRIEKLVLTLDDDSIVLGPGIYSCLTLTHLELHGHSRCRLLRAPLGFGGFKNLVSLFFENLVLPFTGGGAQLQNIISSSPHLRQLTLISVRFGRHDGVPTEETCAIRAPNLETLKLMIFRDSRFYIPEDLPSLEEAAISVVDNDLFRAQEFLAIFRRLCNVRVLTFDTEPYQLTVNPLEGISWKFQKLRVARLIVNFGKLQSVMLIFSVLKLGPFIENLYLKVDLFGTTRSARYNDEYDEGISDDELGEEKLEDLLSEVSFNGLKHISVDGMLYLPNDRWFMKFLLSKAGSLESCLVTFGCWRETRSYAEARMELETCLKVSPQVKLTVQHRGNRAPNPEDS